MPTATITGVSGFIGRNLCQRFVDLGWHVIGTTTHPSKQFLNGVDLIEWRLSDPVPAQLMSADAIVHLACACVTDPPGRGTDREAKSVDVQGTERLHSAWRDACDVAPFILVSSMSSSSKAANQYGRIKHFTEAALSLPGDFILRPGIVTGDGDRGLYNLLRRAMAISPVFPVVKTPSWLYLTDIERLMTTIVGIAERRIPAHPQAVRLNICTSGPMTFQNICEAICTLNGMRKPIFVNMPAFVLPFIDALSFASEHAFFLRERLYGLLPPNDAGVSDVG